MEKKYLIWLYYIAWAIGLFAVGILAYGIIKTLSG